MKNSCVYLAMAMIVTACATSYDPLQDYEELTPGPVMDAPPVEPAQASTDDLELIEHGRYMVELIGCPACHTNGVLIGEPDFDHWLAGSDVGFAYTNPLEYEYPGVVFPSNLTSDPETGIGSWSDERIANAIREGLSRHGPREVLVMPWLAYSKLSDSDTAAIVAYLRSLPPVDHKVPNEVAPGKKTEEQFVHFGIYRNRR